MSLPEKAFVLITDDPGVESSLKRTLSGSSVFLATLPHQDILKVEQICLPEAQTTILVHTRGTEEGHLAKLMDFRKKITMDNVEIVFFSEVRTACDIIGLR